MAEHPGRSFLESGSLSDIQYRALQDCITKLGEIHDPEGKGRIEWFKSMSNHELGLYLEYNRRNLAMRDTIVYEGAMREVILPELIKRLCEGVDMRRFVARLMGVSGV